MEIKEYQEKAARTLAILSSPLLDDLHMVLGMQTEVAELADAYKKHMAYGKELDLVNVKEEMADCLWYIANLCNLHGWDLRDIMDTNIAKLQARYPEKFTNEKALNRDLKKERGILEEGYKPNPLLMDEIGQWNRNTTRDVSFSTSVWTSENAFGISQENYTSTGGEEFDNKNDSLGINHFTNTVRSKNHPDEEV